MTDNLDDSKAPLMEHLIELRTRLMWSIAALIICSVLGFVFADYVFNFLTQPLLKAFRATGTHDPKLIYTHLTGAFATKLKLAFFTGIFIAFPIIANQVWKFVAPGLYKNEKNAALPFLIATPVLFTCGAALCYYVVMPNAFKFFLSFQKTSSALAISQEALPDMGEYLGLVMQFILAFGFAFLLPVLLVLLVRAGLVKLETLQNGRRYAILIATVVAAVITPPDALSMLSLAIPLVLLYEISILVLRFTAAKPAPTVDTTPTIVE